MLTLHVLAALMAGGLFVYLTYAIICPERFE
jgi:K+-transporting ATPase KdpF subunit